jgi:hypothetical protein
MAIADHLPLFKAGHTKRNIAVGAVYLLLLPLLILLIPFYLLIAIGTNRHGLGDTVADSPLGAIPGVSGGGWSAGIVVFVLIILVFGVIGAVAPGDGGDTSPNAELNNTDDVEDADDPGTSDGDSGESEDTDGSTDDSSDDSTDGGQTDSGDGSTDDNSTDGDSGQTDDSGTGDDQDEETTVDEPEPQTFSGQGSDTSKSFSVEGGFTAINLEHTGESNFQVELINEQTGETEGYLTNTIGDYDGAVALSLSEGDYFLDVTADGDWSANVTQPRFADSDVESPPVDASGHQHDWMGPIDFDGTVEVTVEAEDDGNLAVWLADHRGERVDLLANDIGPYEETTVVTQDGIGLLVIETNDVNWRVEVEER